MTDNKYGLKLRDEPLIRSRIIELDANVKQLQSNINKNDKHNKNADSMIESIYELKRIILSQIELLESIVKKK